MTKRMTVVQVLPALEGGGVERGTLEIGKALVEAGHRSIVISGGGRMVGQLTAEGSEHVQWPIGEKSLWTLRLVSRLRRFLREEKVDILHARSRLPAWIAWLAWRKMNPATRPRFVTTVHGLYTVNWYSAIMTKGERVIAVSETARRYVLESYPETDPAKVVTIYRGIDPNEFPRGYRPPEAWLQRWYQDYPFLKGRIVLTLPGRLTRLKGHEDFIDLVESLLQQGHNVHGLVVGGEDPRRKQYAEELYKRVAEKGLEERITFTGHRADVKEIYAVSDVILALSNKPESFGRTVLEALSMGIAVVGYGYGGVCETMRRLYPAGMVPDGDFSRLCDKMEVMLDAKRQAVIDVLPEDYTLQHMSSATLGMYQDIIQ